MFQISHTETEAFGINVYRFTREFSEVDILEMKNLGGLKIFKIASANQILSRSLISIGATRMDTVLYFQTACVSNSAQPVVATENDISEISQLATRVFRGYRNHYTADPRLPYDAAENGYVDWIERSHNDVNRVHLIRQEGDTIVGFLQCFISADAVEIELAGTEPASQGKGIFSDLLSIASCYGAIIEKKKVIYSTQASNINVINILFKNKYAVHEAYDWFHYWPSQMQEVI